jgi:hypothetical protein
LKQATGLSERELKRLEEASRVMNGIIRKQTTEAFKGIEKESHEATALEFGNDGFGQIKPVLSRERVGSCGLGKKGGSNDQGGAKPVFHGISGFGIWNRLLKLPCARFGGQRFGLVLR